MQPSSPVTVFRRRVYWGGGALLAVLVAVLVVNRGELRAAVDVMIAWLRAAGPLVFFIGMALLPAVGFPLMPFSLVAGPVFGPMLGVVPTIGCAIAAVAANVAISYWLGAGAMRPWVVWLVERLGYKLPVVGRATAWELVTVVRLAPGLPFWMQSYLLGVVRAPFVAYMTLSTLIPAGYIAATIAGGDALMSGRGRVALLAFAVLGFIATLVQLLRKRRASVANP